MLKVAGGSFDHSGGLRELHDLGGPGGRLIREWSFVRTKADASLVAGRASPRICAMHGDRASLVHRAARTAGHDQAAGAQ